MAKEIATQILVKTPGNSLIVRFITINNKIHSPFLSITSLNPGI